MSRPRKPEFPRPRIITLGKLRLRIAKAPKRSVYYAKSEMLTPANPPAFFADVTLRDLFRELRQHRDAATARASQVKREAWKRWDADKRAAHMERLIKGRRTRDARAAIRMAGLTHSPELEARALALIAEGASAHGAARELAKESGE